MVGIYKITNPIGQIYIGQSKDIEARFMQHKTGVASKKDDLLKKSFVTYGVESHIFEAINYCYEENLLEYERYWQERYDAIGPNGLNMELTKTDDKPRVLRNKHVMEGKMWTSGSKITPLQVLAIRRLNRMNPNFKKSKVAKKLGVAHSAISFIVNNKTWIDLQLNKPIDIEKYGNIWAKKPKTCDHDYSYTGFSFKCKKCNDYFYSY